MSVFEEAQACGVHFYHDPEALKEDMIDPLIWPAVQQINRSGWCWTAESCQGHPDATDDFVWATNVRPMLRLVCRWPDRGRMLAALHDATIYEHEYEPGLPGDLRGWGFEIWAHPGKKKHGVWCEVLVYLGASTVYRRNQALKVFARLAALVCDGTA